MKKTTQLLSLVAFFTGLAVCFGCHEARAATEADVYCQTGTSSTGFPIFLPASSGNPCPVSASVSASTTATASSTPTAVTAGTGKPLNIDLFSELFVQPSIAGTPVSSTAGLPSNIVQWDGTALGAPSNYGTSPGAVEVPGVNAFVTSSALPTGAATAANQTSVQGTVGAGTAPADMNVGGCQYNATIPSATDTQSLALNCDPAGRLRVNAQPATQNFVTGTATQTGTTSTSLIGAVASNRIYTTAFSCYNSGASASVVLFQDGSAGTTLWATIVPAGGGSNIDGNTALFRTTSGNAVYFAPQTSSTTVGCSAAGFSGP